MKLLISFLLWSLVFVLIAGGLDQLFVRVEMRQPALAEVRAFHVEFRTRLLHLVEELQNTGIPTKKKPPLPSVHKPPLSSTEPTVRPPAVKGGNAVQPESTLVAPAESGGNPRYLYADEKGDLLFADRLQDIPAAYRGASQPLAR